MKKTNRSFAVEYKTGRRKIDRKPNSIWGDLDLKAVARQEYGETTSFLLPENAKEKMSSDGHFSRTDGPVQPVLTAGIPQQNNASVSKEIDMADENETMTETTTQLPAETVTPAPVKQRKPRAKKVVAEADPEQVVGSPAGAEATAGPQRRGHKAKAGPAASVAKTQGVDRVTKTAQAPAATSMAVIDDMADLLRLEEENRSLRKQLSDKLRAENAGLRKRLNLA
ncbi:transcriptional regulator [Pararhizobium sp. PWRC1-1]|uniref:transcriptional regulator n=1 Tax=Pararhizobium sp. PWRC1-1 TaxID=2804566 RepID=UPI003CF7BB76